jgi:hypothetical protein
VYDVTEEARGSKKRACEPAGGADMKRTSSSTYGFTEANRVAFMAHLVVHEEGQRLLAEIFETQRNEDRKVALDSGMQKLVAGKWDR